MEKGLKEIQDGTFAKEFMDDYRNGFKKLYAYRAEMEQSQLQKVGDELRAKMPFVNDADKYSTPEA
jgi:ketol-acid reductoisomerase